MSAFKDLNVFTCIKNKQVIRIAAFGSSNTQRFLHGMHWFDYVELGFKNTFGGGCGQFINSGIGGNTTQNLLDRFDEELALYQPHLVILTIGGNDSKPDGMSAETYTKNLLKLDQKIADLGSQLIYQTYYGCDLDNLDPRYAERFVQFMQIIRECAAMGQHPLVDHFSRWDLLRRKNITLYRKLMRDNMHINSLGNMVMGLDLARHFGLNYNDENIPAFREGYFVQELLDKIHSDMTEVLKEL